MNDFITVLAWIVLGLSGTILPVRLYVIGSMSELRYRLLEAQGFNPAKIVVWPLVGLIVSTAWLFTGAYS